MFHKRTLSKTLESISKSFPVVLVMGPRQVGKTTLLENENPGMRYVSLDHPMDRQLAQEEPALFIQKYPPPVIIDEIQYAPELLSLIKIEVDKAKKPGQFWLTGSQQFHLMHGVSESLAGRVGILRLQGLSLCELTGHADNAPPFLPTTVPKNKAPIPLVEIYKLIWRGFFPAIALNEEMNRDVFYASYLETYLQRDLRDLSRVGDEMSFLKFLRSVAARTAQLLNIAEIARDVGINVGTAKAWLSILETSGLVYLLEPYHSNVTKRLIKSPKLYFLDTGLCCFLTRWTSHESLEAGAFSGAILETFIFSEILKSYLHNGKATNFYYYRNKDKKEVDLLIEADGMLFPVEYKKTAHPNRDDIRHFSVLDKLETTIGHGAVICFCDTYSPINERVSAIPVSMV